MSADALPTLFCATSLVFAVAGIASALWMRVRIRSQDNTLRVMAAQETRFVAAVRRLADAARISVDAVRAEMDRGIRALVPDIDVVLFYEEHTAELTCVAAYGGRAEFFVGTRLALDDDTSLLALALARGSRVTVTDVPHARVLHPGDVFAVAIPLALDAGRRCALYAAAGVAHPTATADRIVQLVDSAAPTYQIAHERTDDRNRAEFDGLTGLLLPRPFRAQLNELVDAARFASSRRIALLFIDTDRFKQWNDHYGHASGDALLRELAQIFRETVTNTADLVARNGGDEFCVVFADCEKSLAIERAERLRATVFGADFGSLVPARARAHVHISASIGVACFPSDAVTASILLEKADEAMYHSKQTGRDAVAYFGVDGALIRANRAL